MKIAYNQLKRGDILKSKNPDCIQGIVVRITLGTPIVRDEGIAVWIRALSERDYKNGDYEVTRE